MSVMTTLPIGPVGVPEATAVLCGGNGELIRALALGLAILSAMIVGWESHAVSAEIAVP